MMLITLAYAVGLGAFLVFADLGGVQQLALLVNQTPMVDKVVHFFMFGLFALLLNAALAQRSRSRIFATIVTGSTVVLVFATLEELSNAFTTHRTCSLTDLLANYLGIVCLGILPLVAWQRQRSTLRRAD